MKCLVRFKNDFVNGVCDSDTFLYQESTTEVYNVDTIQYREDMIELHNEDGEIVAVYNRRNIIGVEFYDED